MFFFGLIAGMDLYQHTIKDAVEISGRGLFTGNPVTLRLKPAPVNAGIRFVRVDLPGKPRIKANIDSVANDTMRVFLKENDVEVECVEHMMSCLSGLGIDNLDIEIDNREMPIIDGSSLKYVEIIMAVGIEKQDAEKDVFTINEKIVVSDGSASIFAEPNDDDGDALKLTYTLDYGGHYLSENYSVTITGDDFREQLAPARTFGLDSNIDMFKQLGLGSGVTDENTFILHKNGQITKPISVTPAKLRFSNECVRHKMLDLLGDLYLSNLALRGHIIAVRSGHFLNIRMAKRLADLARPSNN